MTTKIISLYFQNWDYKNSNIPQQNHQIGDIFVSIAEYDEYNKYTGHSWNGNITQEKLKEMVLPLLNETRED